MRKLKILTNINPNIYHRIDSYEEDNGKLKFLSKNFTKQTAKDIEHILNDEEEKVRTNADDCIYVYKVENIKTGDFYIGQSRYMVRRIKEHKYGALRWILGDYQDWKITVLYRCGRGHTRSIISAFRGLEHVTIMENKIKHGKKCVNYKLRVG